MGVRSYLWEGAGVLLLYADVGVEIAKQNAGEGSRELS
jgi:hypothetical protein